MPEPSDIKNLRSSSNGMALPAVLALFSTLSIGIFVIWIITNQERGSSKNFVVNTKAAMLADAIHVFLTAKAYSAPWSERFFENKQVFPVANAAADSWGADLKTSMVNMYKNDPWLVQNLDYRGDISSVNQDGQKIIIISVIIENRRTGEMICRHRYYEVYRRDLIDTIGEGISLFVDATENNNDNPQELPPELVPNE